MPTIRKVFLEQHKADLSNLSPEAYSIEISCEPLCIIIKTVAPEGAVRAFDSLSQLFYAHSKGPGEVYTPHAPLIMKDAPRFDHRGIMLDISRNWIPPEDVIRTIEAMGLNKLNKLHLHATDSQSWPLEIPSLPRLAEEGAYSKDQIWSIADLEKVQRHGLYHGVEVFLEIDMPGHTASIANSHPDVIVGNNAHPWQKYAAEPPAGQLRLNQTDTYKFLDALYTDLLPRVAPFSTRFHIGGDELNLEVYTLDPSIRSSDKEAIRPHLQRMMTHVTSLLLSHSLTTHIWQEMLLDWDLTLPKNTIYQAWRPGALRRIVEKGHRAIFSDSDEWYLDGGFGTFLDPNPTNPDTPIKHPYADWNPPYKNWRRILAYDPLKDVPSDKKHLVLGGEVCLWSELTDSTTLDFMLWPRAAAAAEMLWKGRGEVGEGTTRRLAEMRERLVRMGVRAGIVQMEWALRNPGECVL